MECLEEERMKKQVKSKAFEADTFSEPKLQLLSEERHDHENKH